MSRNMVGLLAAVGAIMSAVVGFSHGGLLMIAIAELGLLLAWLLTWLRRLQKTRLGHESVMARTVTRP